jgi:MFS family permease
VAALFLVNAVAFANVVPRLPAIKATLALSNTSLGTAVAAMPVGALLSGPLAGALILRFGSGRLAVACSVAMGIVLPLFGVAPAWGVLATAFFLLGALDSVMDVSMNAHALRVQREHGRSIINSLHGLWSIGAVLGGGAGALAASQGIALEAHLVVAGVVVALIGLAAGRWLLAGPDEPDAVPAEAVPADPVPDAGERPSRGAGRRLALLGLLLVLASAVEDAPSSWGAVLLRQELGTSVAVAGLVYIGFQSSMTVGRLTGDWVVDRFGPVSVVRAGGALTALGVGAGLAIGEPVAVIIGFSLAGFGTASLFPVVFHAAGEVPGVSTGHGLAAVAWMARVGFLVTPPIIGVVGDAISLRAGLVLVPVAGALIALLAGVLGHDAAPARVERPYAREA